MGGKHVICTGATGATGATRVQLSTLTKPLSTATDTMATSTFLYRAYAYTVHGSPRSSTSVTFAVLASPAEKRTARQSCDILSFDPFLVSPYAAIVGGLYSTAARLEMEERR